jgi:hypothetical protein
MTSFFAVTINQRRYSNATKEEASKRDFWALRDVSFRILQGQVSVVRQSRYLLINTCTVLHFNRGYYINEHRLIQRPNCNPGRNSQEACTD